MYTCDYLQREPARTEVDTLPGKVLLEFGAPWCGHCIAAQPLLQAALAAGDIQHLKIEDGSGRPLGRSFGVKLWPTLVFLCDGRELARLVRPTALADVEGAVATLAAADRG